jgi:hypothetical protein
VAPGGDGCAADGSAPSDMVAAADRRVTRRPGGEEALTKLERARRRLKEAGIEAEGDRGRPGAADGGMRPMP